jgi:hypothetical protein
MLIDDALSGKVLQEKGKTVLSRLMRARRKTDAIQRKVNFCPFGCKVRDLDDQSYCRHLVGFCMAVYEGTDKNAQDLTEDAKLGGKLFYEPMVKTKGRRKVLVEREKVVTGELNDDGKPDFEWGDPILPKVRSDDVLERVSCSYRVYRDVDKVARELAVQDQLDAQKRELDAREAALNARETDGRHKPDRKARKPMSEEQKAKMRKIALDNLAKAKAKKAADTTPEA